LAKVMQNNTEIGSQQMLANYQQTRARDTRGGLLFTDFLVNTFSSEILGVGALRGAGLGLLDIIKPAKKLLVDRMSFGA
jgi:2-octaprenyl-6-methoxyphenol hydroxylase